MWRFTPCLLLSIPLAIAACGDDDTEPPDGSTPDAPTARDGGPPDAGPPDAGPSTPWPRDLPPASELGGDRRGHALARAIIHLHSPLSHDACDGNGWVDGALGDPECLAHLRTAICATHLDVAMLTDHAPHMNEGTIEDALLAAADDELIRDGAGNAYASIVTCEDGHEVVLTVGSENALMPVGLRRHVLEGVTVDELESAYDAETPAAVDEFRAAGALVLVNHTEQRPLDSLRMLAPDGIEIYNIHANLDPRIRSEYLGLDSDFLADLIRLIMPGNGVAPDLLALAFLEENRNDLDKWDALLAEGVRMPGLAGSDAHENAFANPLADGERADSYRRVMRWFSNHMLVDTTLPRPERYEEALAAARFYVAFEAFGSPVGFDFIAETATVTAEMGETVAPGATLRVVAPTLPPDQPRDPAPDIRLRILRSTATGAVEVAAGTGPTLEHVATEPGAYRAEVFILPNHARPYVGARSDLIREHVWIYSNAIHVVPD